MVQLRVSSNPSLSRLTALLSIDLLHCSDHQADKQEVHLGVWRGQYF